jgi:hypothetical protein
LDGISAHTDGGNIALSSTQIYSKMLLLNLADSISVRHGGGKYRL